ncbi:TIR domain-containing protein [Amycolatopsis thailandensis]|uniref:TIR domain-containing protein n=1 Tax=Amycolatopsis thailandensis TaxID=589330 RepID=UPI00365A4AF5
MIKIFISHSSTGRTDEHGGPTQAAYIRDELCRRLEKDYEVFVDKKIDAAEKWKRRVQMELRQCQAIVFLFDENALKSSRVKDEVAVAMNRQFEEPPLFVVPVLIGSIRMQDIKKAGINDIEADQCVRVEFPGTRPVEEESRWLIDRTVAQFAVLPPLPTEMVREWVKLVGVSLSGTRCDRAALQGAAAILRPAVKVPVVATEYLLATLFLAARGSRQVANAIEQISRAARDRQSFGMMLKYLMPSWVDTEVARRTVPGPAELGSFNGVLILPDEDEELAKDHLMVATQFRTTRDSVLFGSATINTGENAVEELLQRMRNEVAELAGRANWTQFSREIPLSGDRRFILVLALAQLRVSVVIEAARRLRADLPGVGILLLAETGREVKAQDVEEIGRISQAEISNARDFRRDLKRLAQAV